jgi:hypothetical protein
MRALATLGLLLVLMLRQARPADASDDDADQDTLQADYAVISPGQWEGTLCRNSVIYAAHNSHICNIWL